LDVLMAVWGTMFFPIFTSYLPLMMNCADWLLPA
jgi:hypothetical protein